jgi:D-tagatose-1,6-bisphosphate aldolase subunit GatZ/KbaZ
MKSIKNFKNILQTNRNGGACGVYSVCSAHKTVLEASILQAKKDDSVLIVESTSNQVNQFGGYTGMNARDFAAYTKSLAHSLDFPFERIILGGDHLGPNPWQGEKAEVAMGKAEDLVKGYAKEGYKKIHLDTSMYCLDDKGDRSKPLADEVAAERTAKLCKACEDAASDMEEKPLYIIGTEVPVPGGSQETETPIMPTSVQSIKDTLAAMEKAFKKAGIENAWERVVAIVAQPGVEFGSDTVFFYDREKARTLSKALENPPLVFEAHSTDYQPAQCLKQLVEDHFCILKVGPGLTYAYREALFSLEEIEKELYFKINSPSNLQETIEKVMIKSSPNHWEKYYNGTEEEKRFQRRFSLSDRIRYYWPQEELVKSIEKLIGNLTSAGIPQTLLSQYMPHLITRYGGKPVPSPNDLIIAHICCTLDLYSKACGFEEKICHW